MTTISKTTRLTNRGIVTISLLATVCSLPLVYIAYLDAYSSRIQNPNYNGNMGGEVFIPFIVYIIVYLILNRFNNRRRYGKL
ncbi:MAG: hypothetical protein ACLUVC_02365 [Longibaculum sp.]